MSLNYLVWSFVQPSQLLALVLLTGLVATLIGRRRLGRRLLLGGVTVLLIVTYTPLAKWLMAPLEARFPVPAELAHVDGIILLAGAERVVTSIAYGEPHLNSHASRVTTFFRLAQRFPDAKLVHSGGGKSLQAFGGSSSQQTVAKAILAATAIRPGRLIYEPAASNTCDTPRYVRELVQPRRDEIWVVVTSAHHMPRTMACFNAIDWPVVAYPADFKQTPSAWSFPTLIGHLSLLDYAAHEWLGLIYYRLRGDTDELYPAPQPG